MENTEYYTELTGDFMESQCMQDLRNGKIIITDVPFKFRDSNATLLPTNLQGVSLMRRSAAGDCGT